MWKVAIVLLAGCMTTRTVRRDELAAVRERSVGDGVVLRTTGVWKTRLDASSRIRFRDARGKWTDWLEGSKLHVRDDWVYAPAVVDLLDHATRIEMRGLAAAQLRGHASDVDVHQLEARVDEAARHVDVGARARRDVVNRSRPGSRRADCRAIRSDVSPIDEWCGTRMPTVGCVSSIARTRTTCHNGRSSNRSGP
jgi:hypothetical protein